MDWFCLDDTSHGGEDKLWLQPQAFQSDVSPGPYAFGADIPCSSGGGQPTSEKTETGRPPPQASEAGLVVAQPVSNENDIPIHMTNAVEWQGRPDNPADGKTLQTRLLVC